MIKTWIFLLSLLISLTACTSTHMASSSGGAETGAGLGYSSANNSWGAELGAGSGSLVGNQIGQTEDRPEYYGGNPYN